MKMTAREYPGAFDEVVDAPPRKDSRAGRPIRFRLTPFEQIQISTAPDYVIKGIIPKGGLVVIWGAAKCGKSFLAFDMAVHIALGLEYRGRRVQAGPVVYCALEGGTSFPRRVEAWRRRHQHDLQGRGPVPFYLLNVSIDLIAHHTALIADIRAQTPAAPAAVFIDTLNRALEALDENSPGDMGKLIKAVDAIRAAFGCAVVIIHHCGVARSRPRGHTSLAGADDVQIAVVKNSDGIITVTVEHMKDGEPAPPFGCRLDPVELGLDDDRDQMSSCVIMPADLTAGVSPRASKLTGNQARFLDILADAILDAPAQHKTTSGVPGRRTAVSREWLKMCCKSKGWFDPEASENNNRAKVSNMVNALAGKRLIGADALYVWDAR